MKLTKLASVLTLLSVVSFGALAQTEEIKGIRIGMSKAEFKEATSARPFTIAGIQSVYTAIEPIVGTEFNDDKLVRYSFIFKSDFYPKMHLAISSKYPKLKCKTSTVKNAYGATFEDQECESGSISMTKFVDLNTSILSILDKEYFLSKTANDAHKSKGDL